MNIFCGLVLAFAIVVGLSVQVQGACQTGLTFSSSNKTFSNCSSLVKQGAELAYTRTDNTLEIGFTSTASASGGWIGWGINPSTQGRMAGSSVLIAFSNSTGSYVFEYQLTGSQSSGTSPQPSNGSVFTVLDSAVEINGTNMKFYAKLRFSSAPGKLYHLWNRGSTVKGDAPVQHSLSDQDSYGTIDVSTGTTTAGSGAPRQHLKNTHGFLATVSWGILLILGAMCARYLRPFERCDPAWFYLHILFQASGYVLGITAWGIGLYLGHKSVGVEYHSHRYIGITIIIFATLQVLAMFLRPDKQHKYRLYWNVYHHAIGYLTILLGIINIFKGFHILNPDHKWKKAYAAVLSILVLAVVVLEIITWLIWIKNRRRTKAVSLDGRGANGAAHDQPKWDSNNV